MAYKNQKKNKAHNAELRKKKAPIIRRMKKQKDRMKPQPSIEQIMQQQGLI